MDLETIIDRYGWCSDYLDNITGRIYHLPEAYSDDQGRTIVPISLVDSGEIIGGTIVARIPPKEWEDS